MDKIGLQLHINENDKIILTDSKNRKNENRKKLNVSHKMMSYDWNWLWRTGRGIRERWHKQNCRLNLLTHVSAF